MKPRAFSIKYQGLTRALFVDIFIKTARIDKKQQIEAPAEEYKFTGIIDTGASKTAISERVVEKLSLPTISMENICTANGPHLTSSHYVDIFLPNHFVVESILVNMAILPESKSPNMPTIDFLIGMDIISKGDLCISNYGKETIVSFRIPSQENTDYVREIKSKGNPIVLQPEIGRNSPCRCGSGKKYKQCCGKYKE